LSLFFSSLTSGGFFFLFIVAQLHACVFCIALPMYLVVVPTQGFYFFFVVFLVLLLENKYALTQKGVARDKLVFGMLKHDHVSFQILT